MLIVHVAFELRVGFVVPLMGVGASSGVTDNSPSKDDDVAFGGIERACGLDATTLVGCDVSYSLDVPVALLYKFCKLVAEDVTTDVVEGV